MTPWYVIAEEQVGEEIEAAEKAKAEAGIAHARAAEAFSEIDNRLKTLHRLKAELRTYREEQAKGGES